LEPSVGDSCAVEAVVAVAAAVVACADCETIPALADVIVDAAIKVYVAAEEPVAYNYYVAVVAVAACAVAWPCVRSSCRGAVARVSLRPYRPSWTVAVSC